MRVMLVDDNVDAVESMEILLQAFGYEVATAVHPDVALTMLESFEPAAAVIDIGLPGMDGYQLAAEIRRRRAGAPLRLIAFTGYGGAEDIARAQAAGFDAHLVKPVDIDRLIAALNGVNGAGRCSQRFCLMCGAPDTVGSARNAGFPMHFRIDRDEGAAYLSKRSCKSDAARSPGRSEFGESQWQEFI